MDNDNTHKLPQLQGSNYAPWYLALRTYAFAIQANEHLVGNPPPPTNEEELKIHESKQNKLLGAVLSSVSIDILGLLLAPDETPSPHDLVQKVIAHINQSTKEDHQFLKIEAESITLANENIDSYINEHLKVRQKMVAAGYPSIKDETTTIDLLLTGLKKHPTYTPILAHLLSNPPTTIRDFTRMFKSLYNLYQPTSIPMSPPPNQQRFTGDYGSSARNQQFTGDYNYQPRHGQKRQSYSRAPYPGRKIPFNQLCKYHKSLGVRCNHTDSQCRDPGHPKFQNFKPEANDSHTPTPITTPQQHPFPPYPPIHPPYPHQHHDTTAYNLMPEDDNDPNGTYVLDSGAHPTHVSKPTQTMKKLHPPILTKTATHHKTPCTHSGTLHLRTTKNKTLITTAVANPAMQSNLLSVKDLATRYGLVTFTSDCGYIYDTTTTPPTVIGTAPWTQNHYELATTVNQANARAARTMPTERNNNKHIDNNSKPHHQLTPPTTTTTTRNNIPPPTTATTTPTYTPKQMRALTNPLSQHRRTSNEEASHNWHIKLNHAHPTKIAQTAHQRLIPIMPKQIPHNVQLTCSACDTAKLHPAPHKRKSHNYPVGAYVSSDTCGPIKPPSRHGNNHMLLIRCAVSRFVLARFITDRKDIPQHIQAAFNHIITRMNHPLRDLRSDNAKEYTSKTIKAIYQKYGVTHHLRTPHQPQENGIAERMNRIIMQSVRALLTTAGLDDSFWEDAARDTIFKYNIMHHTSINTSPYNLWYNETPKLKRIYAFGQLGTIPIYEPKKKLQSRADPGRYMYATSLTHVVALNLRTGNYQQIRAEDFHPYHKQTDPTATTSVAFKAKSSYKKAPPTEITIDTPPPASIAQARLYPDAQEWEQSHNAELQNLDAHDSIRWMPPNFQPPPQSVIPLMMIYRYKRSSEGHIIQRKARCNLRGDLMKPGLHYDPKHTTTYTADRTTQRLLIAMHATTGFPLEHFDIKSAYLHEPYQHTHPVYVRQMQKFDGTYAHSSTYGKLVGNLYGSPPAAYYYNHGLKIFLESLGYESSEHDPCLYAKRTEKGHTLISTTIDDFLVLASHQSLIDELYSQLLTKYKIKRLGQPSRFLNWTITRTKSGIHISQPDTIDAVLQQTKMTDCNAAHTPYNNKKPLDQQAETNPLSPQDATRYRQILGEIRYITDSTRPDIAYATNRLAQHMAQPQHHHQQALKTLLRYLKGTRTHGLFYPYRRQTGQTMSTLETYSDADFANGEDRKSVTGTVHC